MKIQVLTATALVFALSSSTALAGKSHGKAPKLTNKATNTLAIGDTVVGGFYASESYAEAGFGAAGGRAVAGSIMLEGSACKCRLGDMKNTARNTIAVGNATAGSIHVNTGRGH